MVHCPGVTGRHALLHWPNGSRTCEGQYISELLFFELYVLIFQDLAATIVSIYWGHFLYHHSFIPLPTSLAKVVYYFRRCMVLTLSLASGTFPRS